MRVVAGAARGRRLVAPAGTDVRPTSDRVKEALFSSLQTLLPGVAVADLYAGSGALGLEALSRGAASVTFVEQDRRALDAIRRNVATVALPGTHIVAGPCERALRDPLPGSPFHLAVLDPPYRTPDAVLTEVLTLLVAQLRPGGTVVVERAARDGAVVWPPTIRPTDPRRYGDTALHRAELA